MADQLRKPPTPAGNIRELENWLLAVYRHIRRLILVSETSGDTASQISESVCYHGVSALTAPRVKTLPEAAKLEEGRVIYVQDEGGTAATHAITIQCQGSDTVNGAASVTINSAYGRKVLVKRGEGKFFSA